ncbi:MAG: M50 family metallopeptidase [Desulfarculus sp.]|nr:M50 family metallopeptidase [Desulfarculus sp.]
MANAEVMDLPLPVIRPDIQILAGPPSSEGSPSFTLYDPLRHTFFKVGWAEAIILDLLRRPRTLREAMGYLQAQTTLRLTPQELALMCQQAHMQGLTQGAPVRPVEDLLREAQARRVKPLTWLLHHYIYFRVPLLQPERFLRWALPYVRPLASRPALYVYLVISLLGLGMLLPRGEAYLKTLTYFFNLEGLVFYGVALTLVKVVHEFSHAFVATHYGVRVPVMGLAFVVFWPLAYSDVTDAWRVAERRKRLMIALAGIAAELAVAGLCLFGWALTSPGKLNSVFFVLSSGALLATLTVNLNPGMRWDGYYLLMDWWGIDNLQNRAFAFTLWFLRKWLLGVETPCPEDAAPPTRQAGMIVYAFYTWAYRFTLFVGIALIIYHQFTKTLGIFLFAVEVGWFIAWPVISEVRQTMAICKLKKPGKRLWITLGLLGLALAWLCLPLPRRFSVPAVVMPSLAQVIYAPFSGEIQYLGTERLARVPQGQVLARIGSQELLTELRLLELEAKQLRIQMDVLNVSGEDRSLLPQKEEELVAVETKIIKLGQQISQNQLLAEIEGVVYEWDDTLYAGRFISKDKVLGRIARSQDKVIYAFVGEEDIKHVSPEDQGLFLASDHASRAPVVVRKVSPVREEIVRHPALTSLAQGSLPVVKSASGEAMVLLEAYYLVEAAVEPGDAQELRLGQSGEVRLTSRPASLLVQGLRRFLRILVKESNF